MTKISEIRLRGINHIDDNCLLHSKNNLINTKQVSTKVCNSSIRKIDVISTSTVYSGLKIRKKFPKEDCHRLQFLYMLTSYCNQKQLFFIL